MNPYNPLSCYNEIRFVIVVLQKHFKTSALEYIDKKYLKEQLYHNVAEVTKQLE